MPSPFDARPAFGGSASKVRLALKLSVPIAATVGSLVGLKLLAGSSWLDQGQLTRLVEWSGAWGPVVFVLLLGLRPVTLLPGQVFTAVAGMLWGGLFGSVIGLAGSWLGMVLVVLLGGRLFRRPLARWSGENREQLESTARRHDFLYAVVVTLNPLLPTDLAVALAAGAGGRPRRLVSGSVLGTLPGTVATAAFGSTLTQESPVLVAVSVVGIALSLVGGTWIARNVWASLHKPGAAPQRPRPAIRRVPVPEPVEARD